MKSMIYSVMTSPELLADSKIFLDGEMLKLLAEISCAIADRLTV